MKLCTNKMSKVVLSLVFSLAMLVAFCVASTVAAVEYSTVPADAIVPGKNIYNGLTSTAVPHHSGFDDGNAYIGLVSHGCESRGEDAVGWWPAAYSDGNEKAGYKTEFAAPTDRKIAQIFSIYSSGPSVNVFYGEVASPAYLATVAAGTQTFVQTLDAGITSASYQISGWDNAMKMYGVALIPYYKANYHMPDGSTQTVEFLTDSRVSIAGGAYSGEITGIATSYTVDAAVVATAPAGKNFLGWSTDSDATVAMETVALANADIDLYPVFGEKEALPVVPGKNVLTGDTNFAMPSFGATDPFSFYNGASGVNMSWDGYQFAANYAYQSGNASGILATIGQATDRKTLAIANIYSGAGNAKYIGFANGEAITGATKWLGWYQGWGTPKTTLDAGITEVAYAFGGEWVGAQFNIAGMALIPYYKVTYNVGETAVIVETLGDTSAIGNSVYYGGQITGLPTSYTPETPADVVVPEGYTIVGWATTEGGEVVDTVALANDDIELYAILRNEDDIVTATPGLNLLNGTLNTEAPNTTSEGNGTFKEIYKAGWFYDGSYYQNVAKHDGGAAGDTGIKASIPALDRKAVVTIQTYGDCGGQVKVVKAGETEAVNAGWYSQDTPSSSWAQCTITVPAGTKEIQIYPNIQGNTITGGISVIPCYVATLHVGEETVNYEFLNSVSVSGFGGAISIPTSFAVANITDVAAPEGYEIVGWATTEGGEAVETVALANEDFDLYAILEEVEIPVVPEEIGETETFVIAGEETKELAILTAINGAEYDAVGLVIAADGVVENGTVFEAETVYTAVTAGENTYAAADLGGEYVSAFVIKGMPLAFTGKTFAIPYVVTLDGATIYGAAVEIIVE